jgi:TolA-binding protein
VSDVARFDAAAERAYGAGRYTEAAEEWARAAEATRKPGHRDEARYRQAASLERAGRLAEARAVFERLARESPAGDRAARAAYEQALLSEKLGDTERARAEMDAVVRRYPQSGVAPPALRRSLDYRNTDGESAVRAYLDGLIPSLENTELGEYLHAAYAASLAESGQLAAARDRYLFLAKRYPYPAGGLWDDALFHAAELDRTLGDPKAAIETLERMLSRRETAHVSGSYEKGRYAEAQFRIGELYRDALGDPAKARAAFEKLWARHLESRLRDDAAWNAALLAKAAGDEPGACRDLKALIAELPTTRYAACVPSLCPTLPPPTNSGLCHEYILRDKAHREEAR